MFRELETITNYLNLNLDRFWGFVVKSSLKKSAGAPLFVEAWRNLMLFTITTLSLCQYALKSVFFFLIQFKIEI